VTTQPGANVPHAYAFDHAHRRAPRELADRLGGKGANLAEMTSVLRLPVPPGFTITTDTCREYLAGGWPDGLDREVERQVRRIERAIGRGLGAAEDPLLVSVRSGARHSMPGMMDTVLNLGLNDRSVDALARATDERFAYDSYRRFIALYARVVLGLPGEQMDRLLDMAKEWDGVTTDAALGAETLRRLCTRYLELVEQHTGAPFPQDPVSQLRGAIEAVFQSWDGARARAYRRREGIPHDLGTAVNVQAMVFGNRDDRSGTGVAFSRNAATGDPQPYGDFLVNAQGEDVVAGIRATEDLDHMRDRFPECHAELLDILARLERHYRDMCDTEFTIEQGKLWMLQTRVGKRTGAAAVRMAVDMTRQRRWKISQREALLRITSDHVDALLHPDFAVKREELDVLATGLPASPGAGVGNVYLSADACVEASKRGERVVLVRAETSPEDVHGMQVAEAILTSRGGLVSHAAVVARGWGIPAVVGASGVEVHRTHLRVGDLEVAEGTEVSVSGTEGIVVLGAVPTKTPEATRHLETILEWADRIRRGKVAVRANADTGPDAAVALEQGAQGIGLCRTEHMFLAEDRLPLVRRMILADDEATETAALEELGKAQRSDFAEVLEAMDGLPVTVRLLDPPLHEFLPPVVDLLLKRATEGLDEEEQELLRAARTWQEQNPMLGTRGVRLGVLKPGLYAMQVRALVGAALDRLDAGGDPVIEVMIPLTVSREEMVEARSWVEGAIAEEAGDRAGELRISIGTMVETPRAALCAAGIAEVSDFFSFGTNDLTQMTLGFSRDDVAARIIPAYLESGLLPADPFATIDDEGVGELIRLAVRRGRSTKPDLHLGVCGEHGGDPTSIARFVDAGVDYVSCSPYRVKNARLGVAQALIRAERA
jgi:pyruvate, orthophosphate dikinase